MEIALKWSTWLRTCASNLLSIPYSQRTIVPHVKLCFSYFLCNEFFIWNNLSRLQWVKFEKQWWSFHPAGNLVLKPNNPFLTFYLIIFMLFIHLFIFILFYLFIYFIHFTYLIISLSVTHNTSDAIIDIYPISEGWGTHRDHFWELLLIGIFCLCIQGN